MSPRKSKKPKWQVFTYEELMRRKAHSKPFFMNIDEYEKLKERRDELEAYTRYKDVPEGLDLRKEKLKIYKLLKLATAVRPLT
jgi:hypothetical protein